MQDGASASLSGATHFDKGDNVSVVVTVNDGAGIDTRTSSGVTVLPTAPTLSIVETETGCPDGWTEIADGARCVQAFTTPGLTWFSGRCLCGSGGDLLSITSEADNTQIFDLATGMSGNSFWIGYNDLASEGTWEWASGDPTGYGGAPASRWWWHRELWRDVPPGRGGPDQAQQWNDAPQTHQVIPVATPANSATRAVRLCATTAGHCPSVETVACDRSPNGQLEHRVGQL